MDHLNTGTFSLRHAGTYKRLIEPSSTHILVDVDNPRHQARSGLDAGSHTPVPQLFCLTDDLAARATALE